MLIYREGRYLSSSLPARTVMQSFLQYLPIALTLSCLTVGAQGDKRVLQLMNFLPMTGDVWFGGGACLTPMEMAFRHINARDDILPDYILNHTWQDSKCSASDAINIMYEWLYTHPAKVLAIGPGCSVEAEITAQSSPRWNLTHLSWGAASPSLTDKKKYPRFFRLNPSDQLANVLKVELLKYFNWKKVATINTAEGFHSSVINDFVNKLADTDIAILTEEIFNENTDPTTRIHNIKKQDARIIVASGYENAAQEMLCAAYKVGLYGPKIVWIFPGWFRAYWWRDRVENLDCTLEQMDTVAEGHLLTAFSYYNFKVEKGLANLTSPEFYEAMIREPSYREDLKEYEFISGPCYDSIWAIALTLTCADRRLQDIGHHSSLDECGYDDIVMRDIVTECVYNVSFVGVTGKIAFDKTGEPIKDIILTQIQDSEKKIVGIYYMDEKPNRLEWQNGGIRWAEGTAPRDSTLIINEEKTIPPYLYTVFSFFAGVGIVVALAFIAFNFVHRNNRYVKLSSPNINNVLLVGCVITYSTVFMRSLEQETTFICTLRTITFALGFSMAFGALFSKTWRVYRIFANKKLLRLKIQDTQLVGLVAVFLVIVSVVLITWEILDPWVIVINRLKNEVYLSGNDAEVHPFVRKCVSQYDVYFSWTIYIIEGVLLTFGAFLSFETRKVKIAALNDSRLIGLCLYNVVVLAALGLTLSLVLQDQIALMYGIMSGFIVIGTTTTQLIVFVPKLMAVYWPHHVDVDDRVGTVDGSRFVGTCTKKLESRDAALGLSTIQLPSTSKSTTTSK